MSEQKNKKGVSRRGLLKGTAAAVGTMALAGMDINRAEAVSHKDVPGKWDLKTDVLIVERTSLILLVSTTIIGTMISFSTFLPAR